MKILFVLKYREQPYSSDPKDWTYSHTGKPLSSGLFNSANMIVKMLNAHTEHEAKIVHVIDGNSIHKECVEYKADLCVIEAFWCPPYKFDDLAKALPKTKFLVRNHSETPFLSNEGIAFGWMMEYAKRDNVIMAPNSLRMADDTRIIFEAAGIDSSKIIYLPNYYFFGENKHKGPAWARPSHAINVGCFGAIRPLKNTISQAIAAIEYANKRNVVLNFHINGNRVEGNGDPILKNLRSLFNAFPRHTLVEHEWADADIFRERLRGLDALMQVSFSETFNIVAADATYAGVPVVGSREIPWINQACVADPTNVQDIERVLDIALGWRGPILVQLNRDGLHKSNKAALKVWKKALKAFK